MSKPVTILITILISFISHAQPTESTYVCPPCDSTCDSKTFDKAGTCNVCQMKLITKEKRERDIMEASKEKKKIAFYLQDGVEVLDFAGPMEVFAYAGYEIFTVSKTKEPIHSQGILKVIPDYSISDAPKSDILAFFGGNADNAYRDKKVIDWVKAQTDVEYYFSVCTGAFVLAEAGILENQTATTFHGALDNLENRYPNVKVKRDVRFVDNGTVITTAGVSAGIDGALHMVAKLQGLEKAKEVAFYMEYDKWNPGEGLLLTADNPYKSK
jgi:transcriptional regulator GlxA family with amidase domain